MEKFDLQVMLADGSFADFKVSTDRDGQRYDVLQYDDLLATFTATTDGNWQLIDNPGNLNEDLQNRITTQLNGFRVSL